MTIKKLNLIAACDLDRGIGKNNQLPWHLPDELKYFNKITSGRACEDNAGTNQNKDNIVIVGRKTWDSFRPHHKPLPRRRNIVVTRQQLTEDAVSFSKDGKNTPVFVNSLEAAIDLAFSEEDHSRCFIIGGHAIYEKALQHPAFDLLYLTEIDGKFECDVYFPAFENFCSLISKSEVHVENGTSYTFNIYQNKKT